jgi:hypothetical protein
MSTPTSDKIDPFRQALSALDIQYQAAAEALGRQCHRESGARFDALSYLQGAMVPYIMTAAEDKLAGAARRWAACLLILHQNPLDILYHDSSVRPLVHDARGDHMVVDASSLTVVACYDNAGDANLLVDHLNQCGLWNYQVVPVMIAGYCNPQYRKAIAAATGEEE